MSQTSTQTIAVLICTWQRIDGLARCLAALEQQRRLPDEVIVVVRDSDTSSAEWLRTRPAGRLTVRLVRVMRPGLVAARNAGLAACHADILAMTDDDTAPLPDWTERILVHFTADAAVGGVGGRDRCFDGRHFDDRRRAPVGRLQWFGRMIGNHHLGYGNARRVDFLKGANMSYRLSVASSIRFDERLRGLGAQAYEDSTFSLAVARSGWHLVYDPAILVDHYAIERDEPRHYASIARLTDRDGFRNYAYNGVVAIWDELSPPRHVAFFVWSLLIGTGALPGLLQAVRYMPRLGIGSWQRFWVAQQGKMAAYRDLLAARRAWPERPAMREPLAGRRAQ